MGVGEVGDLGFLDIVAGLIGVSEGGVREEL